MNRKRVYEDRTSSRSVLLDGAKIVGLAAVAACAAPAASNALPPPLHSPAQECGSGNIDSGRREVKLPDTLVLVGLGEQSEVAPAPDTLHFAARKAWYASNEVITFRGRRYAKFGWALGARPPQAGEQDNRVVRTGEYDGVPVFGVPPLEPYPRRIVIRLNACQFQPYAEVSEVR
jgi:hypothetical protein